MNPPNPSVSKYVGKWKVPEESSATVSDDKKEGKRL